MIRFAIVHAFRQARHEARIEQHVPMAATWLKGEERHLLDLSNSLHETTSCGSSAEKSAERSERHRKATAPVLF